MTKTAMKSSLALGLTGFSLIAITYGMARFSWGLMMPAVMEDIPFSLRASGLITACSYLSYCFATLAAAGLVARYGPGLTAVAAALCAAMGLLILACSTSALMLGTGLFIAGLSAGFASPALAGAVRYGITEQKQEFANTAINAGTSAGIIFSVPVLLLMPGGWRASCLMFAGLALICLLPALRYLPACRAAISRGSGSWRGILLRRGMPRLMIVAFISGSASAAWWGFGQDILRNGLHINPQTSGLLWLVSGAAGIAGALTGPLSRYLSMRQIYRLSQLSMALPLILLACAHGYAWWLYLAVAMIGAGYVTLSGIVLVYGAALAGNSPAAGVSVAFFMLAAGQVAGSAVFGLLYAGAGAAVVLTIFAALSVAMLLLPPEVRKECQT